MLSKDASSSCWCPIITSSVVVIDIKKSYPLTDQRSTSPCCRASFLVASVRLSVTTSWRDEDKYESTNAFLPWLARYHVDYSECQLFLLPNPETRYSHRYFQSLTFEDTYILNITIRHCFRLDLLYWVFEDTVCRSSQASTIQPFEFISFPTKMMYGKTLRRCLVRTQNPCVQRATLSVSGPGSIVPRTVSCHFSKACFLFYQGCVQLLTNLLQIRLIRVQEVCNNGADRHGRPLKLLSA